MMEIDWKYDNIRAEIKIGDIVTFKSNDGYRVGVVNDTCYAYANVLTNGIVYTVGFSKIVARANFDDVVHPAKPKSKFPTGALSWDEIREINRKRDRLHVWVKFFNTGGCWPAIIDSFGSGDVVIVWCASHKENWLREDGYGTKYVCYLNKPNED